MLQGQQPPPAQWSSPPPCGVGGVGGWLAGNSSSVSSVYGISSSPLWCGWVAGRQQQQRIHRNQRIQRIQRIRHLLLHPVVWVGGVPVEGLGSTARTAYALYPLYTAYTAYTPYTPYTAYRPYIDRIVVLPAATALLIHQMLIFTRFQ